MDRGTRARPAGRVLATAGDADTAEALYRDVLEWSEKPRPHGARESLFLALAEDPGAAARAGLDDLGQPTERLRPCRAPRLQ